MSQVHARSDEAREYRKLYDSKAWKDLRAWQLRIYPLCRRCTKYQRRTAATIVNHVKPHKGDTALFFNPLNLESSCKPCHDGATQSFERTGIERGCDASGTPNEASSHWHETGQRRGDRG